MKERLSTSCKELLLLTEESIKLLRIENAGKIRNSLLLKKCSIASNAMESLEFPMSGNV